MKVFVLDAMRTPVSPRGGSLKDVIVRNLASPIVSELLKRQNISPIEVEKFIMGNALNAGGNPARVVALQAGLSEMVSSLTIDTNRNSGIDAIILGAEKIKAGTADIVIAGGAESVSRSPVRAYRPLSGDGQPVVYSRPAFSPWHGADPSMKECAQRNEIDGGISEDDQFDWYNRSLSKAHESKDRMKDEKLLMSSILNPENGQISTSSTPKFIQDKIDDIEYYEPEHAHHAIDADAAAFVILVSEKWLEKNKRFAPVELSDMKTVGSAVDDPSWAAIDCCRSIIEDNSLSVDGIDVFEIFEVFASQALYCIDQLGIDKERVNVAGGELARGNPIGAGSAVSLVRLFHELKIREAGQFGLSGSAAAGGIGSAVLMQAQ